MMISLTSVPFLPKYTQSHTNRYIHNLTKSSSIQAKYCRKKQSCDNNTIIPQKVQFREVKLFASNAKINVFLLIFRMERLRKKFPKIYLY